MSVSITHRETVIFYGYVFDADTYYDRYPDATAAIKAILAAAGMPDPYDAFPEGADYADWADRHDTEIEAYLDAWTKAEAALPVGTGTHGSNAVPTPYLYVAGTRSDTPRGTPRANPAMNPIHVVGRDVDPEWKTVLDTFLTSQSITPPTGPNQPSWWSAAFEDRD
jgi:hypothetical protein